MQVQAVRNENINFGNRLPEKKTYRVMHGIYKFLKDEDKAMEYRVLDHEARARLHYMKHKKAEAALVDRAYDGDINPKLRFFADVLKLRAKYIYEKAMSVYYYYF